jgi:hypothetical protein
LVNGFINYYESLAAKNQRTTTNEQPTTN